MSNFIEGLFAFNPLSSDPNLRDSVPQVIQLEKIAPGAMTAGVVTADIKSPFGKGKGEVYGIQLLNTLGDANEIIGASVATHASNDGELTVTFNSNDALSTTDIGEVYCLIYGKIHPNNPS